VLIGGPRDTSPELVFETSDVLIEAPNWTLDGSALYVNGDGLLWRLELARPEAGLIAVSFDGLPPINNDHVLDPDGRHVFLSADDGHIYRGALAGGEVERVGPDDGLRHFLHGVSADGRLAYVEIDTFDKPGRLMVLAPGSSTPEHVATGGKHIDGPEWSPDGAWILYNSEDFTTLPGHAQLTRIPDGGGTPERLVESETVDWFPHVSPDGGRASYISFPLGTLGHPPDREVVVHVVATDDWGTPIQSYPLFGGQGTINVNSWSPDSARFAFVAYPM
jgi:Tol biopolymer transport system component